mmetsp:Transcript_97820/g.273863  ORF Transcript_97820/g.273863 Transcript_97820/m.273863 type:complete len:226 (-) Transcript_97820:916-1593(-)
MRAHDDEHGHGRGSSRSAAGLRGDRDRAVCRAHGLLLLGRLLHHTADVPCEPDGGGEDLHGIGHRRFRLYRRESDDGAADLADLCHAHELPRRSEDNVDGPLPPRWARSGREAPLHRRRSGGIPGPAAVHADRRQRPEAGLLLGRGCVPRLGAHRRRLCGRGRLGRGWQLPGDVCVLRRPRLRGRLRGYPEAHPFHAPRLRLSPQRSADLCEPRGRHAGEDEPGL